MNYENILSDKVKNIPPSGIRKYFDVANQMSEAISLGVGEPDFITPKNIREVGIAALMNGETKYTANRGIDALCGEISAYLKKRFSLTYDGKKEIMITVGASEAIDCAIRAIINPGDEVIVVEPCFVSYGPCVLLAGGVPISLVTRVEDNFKLTANILKEAITDKTKAILMSFPNNPTGAIMTREDLAEIAYVLKDKDIIIISDEIYGELTYNGKEHVSVASFPELYEKTILISGFSKAFAMTGWRLGYACCAEPIMNEIMKIHQYLVMSAPTISQFAAVEALRNSYDSVIAMRSEYDMRRKYIVDRFNSMGLHCFEPEGAFYVFPSIQSTKMTSDEFCTKLLESKAVAVVPGDAFGRCGEGFIRVCYAYSLGVIEQAVDRIEEFVKEL